VYGEGGIVDLEHLALLGPPERLPAIVRTYDIERVVIAFSNESHDQTLTLIRSLNELATSGLRPDRTLLLRIDPDPGRRHGSRCARS
jgi:hypothetical protein